MGLNKGTSTQGFSPSILHPTPSLLSALTLVKEWLTYTTRMLATRVCYLRNFGQCASTSWEGLAPRPRIRSMGRDLTS